MNIHVHTYMYTFTNTHNEIHACTCIDTYIQTYTCIYTTLTSTERQDTEAQRQETSERKMITRQEIAEGDRSRSTRQTGTKEVTDRKVRTGEGDSQGIEGPHTVQSDTTRCGDSRVGHAAKRPALHHNNIILLLDNTMHWFYWAILCYNDCYLLKRKERK